MMDEEWRDIKGYEGRYEVSNHGRIRTKCRNKDKVMKQLTHYHGYKFIFLYSIGRKRGKKTFVHRIVAEAFLPNEDQKPYVNHIDCNKGNNIVVNLEWMSVSENTLYYYKMRGVENPEDLVPF